MSVIEMMDNLFFMERGYLNANHFAYRSDEPVLIDTAYVGDFDVTERHLLDLGVDLSRVGLIVNTHCHCDHIGGNKIVQDRSGCAIALHRIGKHFIDTRDDWSTWWRYYMQEADFFHCSIAPEEGDIVSAGPHDFEVMHTPGHAADGIVLYNREQKVLISSDTVWENDAAAMTVRVEGSIAPFSMMESLTKIEKLDVKVVYPGHGSPFTDFRGTLARARNRLAAFMDNRQSVGADLLKKIIVYTLMMERRVQEEEFFQFLMTTPWFVET